MATVHALPVPLREKLTAVARRVRLLRVLRGVSLLVLVLLATGGGTLLLDAWLRLPAVVRLALFAGWLALGAVTALLGLVLPLCRRLDPNALAAVIEEEYPHLGERLTSTVDLAGNPELGHGSRRLIALLIDETDARTGPLDFLQAVSGRGTALLAAAAGFCLLLTVAAGFVWPDRLGGLAGRFFLAGWQPAAEAPFVLDVQPGDAFAARGRPLTLSVRLHARDETTTLPATSTLLITNAGGASTRLRMLAQPEKPNTFSVRLDAVAGDFRYQVEAGAVRSEVFQVTAVDPVELAADSPAITISPPEYARAGRPPETVHGLADLAALQHSTVRFDFHFHRPAAKAYLVWPAQTDPLAPNGACLSPEEVGRSCDVVPAGGKSGGCCGPTLSRAAFVTQTTAAGARGTVYALDLSPDRTRAMIELPAREDGPYRLVLEAEYGIRTVFDARPVTVRVDQPPAFVKVAGTDATGDRFRPVKDTRQPGPEDIIPLEVIVSDDVGVDRVEVEYHVNDGESVFEPIPLEGQGSLRATGTHGFALEGKVKEGDVLRYRIRAADNRRVPAAGLGPQVIYHPAGDWLTLKIACRGGPPRQQEVAAQREQTDRRLSDLIDRLRGELRGVYKLRMESARHPALNPVHARDLGQLQEEDRAIEAALRELARDLAEAPALRPLAERARDVADSEMTRADTALQQAARVAGAEPRGRQLAAAERELAAALVRLENLRKNAEQVAQGQLDPARLRDLAEKQQQLADRAGDSDARNQADQLQRQQAALAHDLERMTEQSEPLRRALEGARAEQARQLAERARALARAERELAEQNPPQPPAELARKQQELAEQAAQMAQQTQPAARTAKTDPLKPEAARQAAEALQRGDVAEARQLQERSAREMERLTTDLEQAAEQARDPKEAARRLARLQQGLEKRLQDEMKKSDTPAAQREPLQELQRQQKAIQRAAERLPVPEQDRSAQQARREAAQGADQASRALEKPDARQAARAMQQARQALEQLAERLPAPGQQAPPEAAQLRRDQEQMVRQADQVRRLAQQQRDLMKQTPDRAAEPRQQAPQEDLQRQAKELARDLQRLAPDAVKSVEQAHDAMQQARDQDQRGNQSRRQQAQQQAARQLERAAQQTDRVGQQMTPQPEPQPGQALQQAQSQMGQAQNQLAQREMQDAQSAMQQAARSLQQAAQQMAQQPPGQPGQPSARSAGDMGAADAGVPDLSRFDPDLKQYAGKSWGELPGELRTRIIQDMKARYGDDYGRIIKLYFEQMADTRGR